MARSSILLAVGADYNLLLVRGMKEEIPAGSTRESSVPWAAADPVGTAARHVFEFTLMSMSVQRPWSWLPNTGPTMGWACLFDTW